MKSKTTIETEEAKIKKGLVVSSLHRAFAELQDAQEYLANIEGDDSAALYDAIADAYTLVRRLRDRALKLQPAGMFS